MVLGGTLLLGQAATVSATPATQDAKFDVSQQNYTNTRNLKYCEMFLFFNDNSTFDVYNSTDWDCPDDVWEGMDLDATAADNGADKAQQNGPQYWMCDELSLYGSAPMDIGGVQMRYGVTFNQSVLGGDSGGYYTVFSPQKNQYMKYAAGKETYELVDADGNVYALQGRKNDISMEDLQNLGDKMTQLPAGWAYRTRVLTEDVEVNMSPDKQNPSVTDEFDQTYVQIPSSGATSSGSDTAGEAPKAMPATGAENMPLNVPVLALVVGLVLVICGAALERIRA